MMAKAQTEQWGRVDHPAPQREHVASLALLFGVWAAPLIWSLQLSVNTMLAGSTCFKQELFFGVPSQSLAETLMIVTGIIALAVSLGALAVSWRNYDATRHEHEGADRSEQNLIEVGEGRTRFLSMVGMIFSGSFFLASIFTLLGLFMVPLCVH